jgi:hypothetical protein
VFVALVILHAKRMRRIILSSVPRGKSCPNATLATTNPTWPALGVNPGLRGEKSASKLLNIVMACNCTYFSKERDFPERALVLKGILHNHDGCTEFIQQSVEGKVNLPCNLLCKHRRKVEV